VRTRKQRVAAKRIIKKAAQAAQRKRTIAHLPRKTRTALGKEGAKAAQETGWIKIKVSDRLRVI
jgi:hypothetical protein